MTEIKDWTYTETMGKNLSIVLMNDEKYEPILKGIFAKHFETPLGQYCEYISGLSGYDKLIIRCHTEVIEYLRTVDMLQDYANGFTDETVSEYSTTPNEKRTPFELVNYISMQQRIQATKSKFFYKDVIIDYTNADNKLQKAFERYLVVNYV